MTATDPRNLRNCLGHFASGVTVVTTSNPVGGAAEPHGATVNSFTSVSIDPPLVLVSLDRRSKLSRLLEDRPFVINILTAGQRDLALQFAGRPTPGLVVDWVEAPCGPRLAGSLAYISCSPWRRYDGGDHVLFLGQVEGFEFSGGEPLVFFRGEFQQVEGFPNTVFAPGDILHTPGWGGETPLFLPRRLGAEVR
ncbi:flavin reductase family protein [Amycolatopsis thermoflava]|uniref:flavin reductase family protein n=1 Tax=Amycolatopsis TaxID=1813 RepID=UPI0033B9CFEF